LVVGWARVLAMAAILMSVALANVISKKSKACQDQHDGET
jgi:hypothetical protein